MLKYSERLRNLQNIFEQKIGEDEEEDANREDSEVVENAAQYDCMFFMVLIQSA